MSRMVDKSILDAIAAAGAVEHSYVSRQPDVSSDDFAKTDFTDDVAYNVLNLSAVVPVGAVVVFMACYVKDNLVNSTVSLRRYGNSNAVQTEVLQVIVANMPVRRVVVVGVDDQKVEISINPKPTDWNNVDITVVGWFV